jgi:5-methylcytosine-specific restriction endonuclease McrA
MDEFEEVTSLLQPKLPPVKRDKCGTYAGYNAHVYYKELNCEDCLAANREYRKKYYKNNTELFSFYSTDWAKRNKNKVKTHRKKWNDLNKEYKREACRKRRAIRQNSLYVKYSEKEVLFKYGTNCHLCNLPIDLLAPRAAGAPGWESGLHIDHIIPIVKGGPDTIENVRPSHGFCNISKGAKMTEDFEIEIDPDLFEEDPIELDDLDYDKHALDEEDEDWEDS